MQPTPLLIIASVLFFGVASSPTASMSDDGPCHEFVKASIAYQKTLAEKVKALNGRTVYLFDATGFAAGLQDAVTAESLRYKTGTLDGRQVDAVLSVSAQTSLSGPAGAQTYLRWAGQGQDIHVDDHGVHI
ncbi:uncharacterized protein LOC117652512 [Thrips palmi]|uniref:Uncharacterized protein LOC117652512 n=1 Tax=Thrips palmi TaxID=161013 RepID=A0A6P9A7S7_THRPL|nr:uncharacterized protein LOC117652512 [Thrips palmi]